MRFLPSRLRESCQRGRWALSPTKQDLRAPCGHACGDLPMTETPDAPPVFELPRLNAVYLSGVLADDPQSDSDRAGEPVTLLTVAFLAPDPLPSDAPTAASCEVEVPAAIAAEAGGELQLGAPVFITGSLSGGGGVLASSVRAGEIAE